MGAQRGFAASGVCDVAVGQGAEECCEGTVKKPVKIQRPRRNHSVFGFLPVLRLGRWGVQVRFQLELLLKPVPGQEPYWDFEYCRPQSAC